MLIALAGRAAGYDGNFDFSKIGKYVFEGDIIKKNRRTTWIHILICWYSDYTAEDVPYVAMRGVGARLGLLMIPMIYMTLRQSGISIHASVFAALMLCYGN